MNQTQILYQANRFEVFHVLVACKGWWWTRVSSLVPDGQGRLQNLEMASLCFHHTWGCANSIPSPPGIKTFERSWVSEPDAWSSWPEKTCLKLALGRYFKAILLTKTHESRIWLYHSHNLAINALTPWAFTCCKLYHTKTGQARSSGWGALRLPGRLHSL